jgi:predicted esterase
MKRALVLSLAAAVMVSGMSALTGCNGANDHFVNILDKGPERKGARIKTLVRGDRQRKFGVFIPYNYSDTGKYPVIVFLHGMGEGGNDSIPNLRVGLAPFVADKANEFNFICIFPQSESGSWDENSEAATDVIASLDMVLKEYPGADADRVSLTGLSTGGYGTWAIGAKYKERFAALVPMGSNASASGWADKLVNMPIWSFHNSGDPFAAAWNDSTMVSKLQTMGNKNCTYTEYPAGGHNCWEAAYGDGQVFSWLMTQRRAGASPVRATGSAAPVAKPAAAIVPVVSPVVSSPVRSNASGVVPATPY